MPRSLGTSFPWAAKDAGFSAHGSWNTICYGACFLHKNQEKEMEERPLVSTPRALRDIVAVFIARRLVKTLGIKMMPRVICVLLSLPMKSDLTIIKINSTSCVSNANVLDPKIVFSFFKAVVAVLQIFTKWLLDPFPSIWCRHVHVEPPKPAGEGRPMSL